MKCKNTIAMVLAGAMLLPSNAFAADLSQYKDFPNDWSAKSLEQAIDDGLLNGSNGMIDAKGLLTRAQMAAIVSRSFGAAKTASLDDYRDVLPSAWYYSDMGKAVKMGAFQGANGLLNPDAPITREEAFTVLARAFALEGGGSAALKDFVDGGTVSSWASESVAALVAGGYVNGANGMLNLKNNITRAEFAKVITGMAASYVGAEGVSSKTVEGNVIVRESGASLSGMTINGDLIIADSADKVSLDGVKVSGRIVIRGASTEASLKNSSAGKGVLVSNPNGAASLSVSGGSVGTVTAKSDLVVSGSVDNIVIAEKAALTVQSGASVGSVTVSAAGASVSGAGTVSAVQANANNVTVSTKNTKVTAASGVSGVKAGDKAVDSGKTETVGTASSGGGSSSGGSSSSRSDYSYVLMNIPYDEFYKAELSENAPAVDAVSSATKNKTRNGSLAGGSYHVNRDGSDITGVTYPVRVKTSDLSGLKQVTDSDSVSITVKNKKNEDETSTYIGKDALFESASYSYYALSDTPSYYKEATLTNGKWSFGKATGAASEATATIAKFKAPGHHANYEMEIESDKIAKGKKVYAVVLTATDGTSCGLHHVTEIWHVTKLGFKADPALVGKNISAVTYYTDDGIIKLNLAKELHVPYIAEGAKAEVAKSDADAKETTLTLSGFPEDFAQNVKVPKGMTYADGKISFGDALPGSYTVTVSDAKGKYADVTASFTVSTSKTVAQYDASSVALKKASDATSDADFTNFLKNITSVKVGDKKYAATDKDAVTIIKKDGAIDEDAKSDGEALFADGKEKTLTVSATGYPDLKFSYTPTYTYAYAAVPYGEYWRNESVYLEDGSAWDASSNETDFVYPYVTDKETKKVLVSYDEKDKGAFDATSRATARHGIHRGSYQQVMKFHTTENTDLEVSHWIVEGKTATLVLKDGTQAKFVSTSPAKAGDPVATITMSDGTEYHMTGSTMTGIKYVPVKVKTADFEAFKTAYEVTENGGTLTGGYTERMLLGYTDLVAAVDADTEGLKEVTKSGDSFSFGARQDGTGSGIKGTALKKVDASKLKIEAQNFSGGTYGAMFRVHITNKNKADASSDDNVYGQLGSRMQSVTWQYYGNGDTVLRTYGTKFAADIWMHGSNGIQLGLTDSLRAKLPEGTDGTGKWVGTIHALGYEDFTFEVNLEAKNVRDTGKDPMTEEQKTQLTALKDQAAALLTKYDAATATDNEKLLKEHYDEAVALLENENATTSAAKELLDELPGMIKAVQDDRANKPVTNKTADGEAYVSFGYTAKVTVTFDSDGKVVSVVDNDTTPDSNSSYWNIALGHFDRFVGVTKDTVDTVDAKSGATVSMNAVKQAVKDALSK